MALSGEVEVADLLSVSLVREMSIQLPLSNLTWSIATAFCKALSRRLPKKHPTALHLTHPLGRFSKRKFAWGLMGLF
jgi:hypothetical protein